MVHILVVLTLLFEVVFVSVRELSTMNYSAVVSWASRFFQPTPLSFSHCAPKLFAFFVCGVGGGASVTTNYAYAGITVCVACYSYCGAGGTTTFATGETSVKRCADADNVAGKTVLRAYAFTNAYVLALIDAK